MRRIGRLRSEASPSKVAVTRMAADDAHHQPRAGAGIAEIERRRPGRHKPPMPTPRTTQRPSPSRSTSAPSARAAAAVRSTSSPSSRPSTRVSPMDEQTEDHRPMRDRLVAGRAKPSAQRGAGGSGKRGRLGIVRHGRSTSRGIRPEAHGSPRRRGGRRKPSQRLRRRAGTWPVGYHGCRHPSSEGSASIARRAPPASRR